MDTVFKALSDPNRRQILELLQEKDLPVSEIGKHLNITGATLSHHLDILKRARLVVPERQGQFIFYSLNTSVAESVLQWLLNNLQKKD